MKVTYGQVWWQPTPNLCSAFNPSKVHTHSSEHTHTPWTPHTPWTHTRSSGQPFMLRCPGSSWGFGALLNGLTSVVVLWRRERWTFTPPTYNSCRPETLTRNLWVTSPTLWPLGHDVPHSLIVKVLCQNNVRMEKRLRNPEEKIYIIKKKKNYK